MAAQCDPVNVLVGEEENASGPPKPTYDFVEKPPQDFFCPVTLKLLTEPHQTTCCGNHLSQEAVSRLQRDGKPCPICNESQLSTVVDKYMNRRVNGLKVRCPGCKWEGEVCSYKGHVESCPKRPWRCQHCDFRSTYDKSEPSKHYQECTKYPVVCPNSCEVGNLPRCEVEAHVMVCPLQLVDCEYAGAGCGLKMPRKDLESHVKESEQQHLLNATRLNIRLTQELLASHTLEGKEKEKEYRMFIEKKDKELAEKDQELAKKNDEIIRLQKQVTALQIELAKKIPDENYVDKGFSRKDFTVTLQRSFSNDYTDWTSSLFNVQGYQLKLKMSVVDVGRSLQFLSMKVSMNSDPNADKMTWPIDCVVHLIIANQLGDYNHYKQSGRVTFWKPEYSSEEAFVLNHIMSVDELKNNPEKGTQYMIDERYLKFYVFINMEKIDTALLKST